MTTETYEILAVKYAERTDQFRAESFIMPAEDDHATPHPMDYFVWVIRNSARTILVDTGFDEAEGKNAHPQGAARTGRRARVDQHIRRPGRPADRHAPPLRPRRHARRVPEGAFPCRQPRCNTPPAPACAIRRCARVPFTAEHVCDMVRNVFSGRVVFHEGDAEIAPGITVHKVGGHSRGLQCVRVATASGPVVLASDASHYYENFEQGKVFPIVVDVENTLRGYSRLNELAASRRHIIPGHDPLVLQRYPSLNSQTNGMVVRLDVPRPDA